MDSKLGGFTTGSRVTLSGVPAAIAGGSNGRLPRSSGRRGGKKNRAGRGEGRLPAGPPLPPTVMQEMNDRETSIINDLKNAESTYASGTADARSAYRMDKGRIRLKAGEDRVNAGEAAAASGMGFSGNAIGAARLRIRDAQAEALAEAASKRADRQATLDEMLALARSQYRNSMLGLDRDRRRVKNEVAANIRGVA